MFGSKNDNASKESGNIDTLIGHACRITGDISSKSSIRIEGHLEGNVTSEGLVTVAEKGSINGDIKSKDLVVYGTITGSITTQSLHVKPTSKIQGDVDTQNLNIESGAKYDGVVSMKQAASLKADTNEPKKPKLG